MALFELFLLRSARTASSPQPFVVAAEACRDGVQISATDSSSQAVSKSSRLWAFCRHGKVTWPMLARLGMLVSSAAMCDPRSFDGRRSGGRVDSGLVDTSFVCPIIGKARFVDRNIDSPSPPPTT